VAVRSQQETIAAVATPVGNGGIGVVRVSGPQAKTIAEKLLKSPVPSPRTAAYQNIYDEEGLLVDKGIVLWFPAPHSFTGEDVVEFQGHGGTVVMRIILNAITRFGATIARPGEFSERAFLNDKIDLAQAEAIADLIESGSELAAKSALRSMQGEFSLAVNEIITQFIHVRMYVESAIDFPEEEIDFMADDKIQLMVDNLKNMLNKIERQALQGNILREGMVVVIAGKPNVGKSSLLNRLSGSDSAIVTNVPGTTRDVIKEYIQLDGMPLHIIDTAGIRDTDDVVEQEGVRRAKHELTKADKILLMVDELESDSALDIQLEEFSSYAVDVVIIRNKIDLSGKEPNDFDEQYNGQDQIGLSVKNNKGIDKLKCYLKESAGFRSENEDVFMARKRHITAIKQAKEYVEHGMFQLENYKAGELLADDLRQAQNCMSQITGKYTSDDLLGEIFSSFCIGK
jgi:tRNA modification GTPase